MPLTHEEHAARAMLLGRWYDWRDSTYVVEGDDADTSANDYMVDGDTLENVSHSQSRRRMINNGNDGENAFNWPGKHDDAQDT